MQYFHVSMQCLAKSIFHRMIGEIVIAALFVLLLIPETLVEIDCHSNTLCPVAHSRDIG